MNRFVLQDILGVLDLLRPEVAVEEVEGNHEVQQRRMYQPPTLISSHPMPSSVRRIWSRRLSLDPQSERTRQMRRLLRNRLPRQVGTISRPPSLTTYRAKPRNDWRAAEIDQVDESGVGKNRRRISRHSARAASIMDIVADIVDEDEDGVVEDTEVEATVETANQNVVVVAIEDVVMHKQVCNNCTGQTSKAARRIRHSLNCIKSFSRFAISVGGGSKPAYLGLFSGHLSARLGNYTGGTGRGGYFMCV